MNLQHNQNLKRFSGGEPVSDRSPSLDETGEETGQEEINFTNLSTKLFGDSLPVQATSNDVREVVRFFKNKPSGLSFAEVLNSEPRRIFEPRKMEAYEYWGILKRSGERLVLTPLGNKLAEIVASESLIFEEIISAIPIYVEIIKWISRQNLKLVTHPDITEFFTQLQKQQQYINISEAEVVSFFSLCHAAELGVATVGKRGQPARLRIETKSVEDFLSQNKTGGRQPRLRPLYYKPSSAVSAAAAAAATGEQQQHHAPVNGQNNGQKHSLIQQVYVSVAAADAAEITESLYSALELADFESVTYGSDKDDDYLQSERLQKMRLCQAGVIVISDEDCHSDFAGKTEIKSERLTEITAAAGLFNWRVVIIWNSLLPIPEYLENYSLHLLPNASAGFKTSYETVKLLKNMKYQQIKQANG